MLFLTTDMKTLLDYFGVNGQILGLHPGTEKLEPPCTA